MIRVSIIIKTLNEEKNIRRAIESSLDAVAARGGEVVIADSASTDRTIEIAKQFPVTIVQIKNPDERCCGIGPQLGYQYTRGDYVYILDGDMELKAPFLQRAIEILDSEPDVAGVGGYIHEMRVENLEVQGRVKRFQRFRLNQPPRVECLNGGGLYRRAAIEDVGYLSDRNLHAFEEYDLGARLRVKGWRLVLLEDRAVDHYSYAMSSTSLMWHRMRSGRYISPGELLRAAIASHYVGRISQEVRVAQLAVGVWLYWLMVILASRWVPGTAWIVALFLFALVAPMVGMGIRQKSLMLGVYSILTWHFNAVGFLIGLSRRRRPALDRIDSQVLQMSPAIDSSAIRKTS